MQGEARGETLPHLQAEDRGQSHPGGEDRGPGADTAADDLFTDDVNTQVFTPDKDRSTSVMESSPGLVDTDSPETSPVSSPEPSFRPRLPTYFLSLRHGTRIGNEDFSLNSLREAGRGLEGYLASSPSHQRVANVDSDSDIREFDFPGDSHPASFGFLD